MALQVRLRVGCLAGDGGRACVRWRALASRPFASAEDGVSLAAQLWRHSLLARARARMCTTHPHRLLIFLCSRSRCGRAAGAAERGDPGALRRRGASRGRLLRRGGRGGRGRRGRWRLRGRGRLRRRGRTRRPARGAAQGPAPVRPLARGARGGAAGARGSCAYPRSREGALPYQASLQTAAASTLASPPPFPAALPLRPIRRRSC